MMSDRKERWLRFVNEHVLSEEVDPLVGAAWERCRAMHIDPMDGLGKGVVGANAIGTALAIDQPVRFVGEDHYCITHHQWTCSATTIHDEKGDVIGCLNMSGDREMANSHTLGIVVAAAYTIERQMALKKSHQLLETTFESMSDGMLITDQALMIIKANNRAADILGIRREDLIMRDVRTVFIDMNFNIDMEYLKNKGSISVTDSTALVDSRRVNCSVNMVPNIIDSCICGFGIAFKETKYLHRTVNKVAGNIASYRFEDIVGESEQMLRVIASAKKIAKTRSSVLIEGESGTGKELFAQAIHNFSTRSKGPFVAINCASLPRELIESELFGYERGAFTGALKEGKTGKFELAEGGTIFLDEIGEMPIEVQAKLLRVLDNYAISRIGSRYEKKLDVRIIAATNRNLMQEAENKNFRYDLYYRLNVFRIELPALRERRNDIRVCAQYFLETLNQQSQNGVKSYSADFMEALEQYRWVGNVRELQNIVERAYFLCDDQIIMRDYLPKHIAAVTTEVATAPVLDEAIPAILNVEDVEKRNIINMLLKTDKNVLVAAKKLSMSKSTIYRKIQKYEIDISRL